jgi:hypothetical protein
MLAGLDDIDWNWSSRSFTVRLHRIDRVGDPDRSD